MGWGNINLKHLNLMAFNFNLIDEAYLRYGYEIKRKNQNYRVYVLHYGLYDGADIVRIDDSVEIENVKNDFSNAGFACRERTFSSIKEVEETLFKGFFGVDFIKNNLNAKYSSFISRQTKLLGEKIKYEYINTKFDVFQYDGDEEIEVDLKSKNIIETIYELINLQGSFLIIIEAAAGFGKTCTAFEIMNMLKNESNFSPFFTELSRNRDATVFKHILWNEMETEYQMMIKTELVKFQIAEGRVPLIIDGFDELLSKDPRKKQNSMIEFEEVEAMITTIGDLLDNNSKIILTSRRTAIFTGSEFKSWIKQYDKKFNTIRISIYPPKIEDWLDQEKIELLSVKKFPIKQIANPVLLSYLRALDKSDFIELIEDSDQVVAKYFNTLLEREIDRQELYLTVDEQMVIFKKLAMFMAECDFTSEHKTFIKDVIRDYNIKLLESSRSRTPLLKRRPIDELADTLTNHALLDRLGRRNNYIGFINEFIFGSLVGFTLIEGLYEKSKYKEFQEIIADTVVTSFEVQSVKNKNTLWDIFNSGGFNFSDEFLFTLDLKLKSEFLHVFDDISYQEKHFDGVIFGANCLFEKCVFINCNFNYCIINNVSFKNCSFVNCNFYQCTYDINFELNKVDDSMMLFGCTSDNDDFLSFFTKRTVVYDVEAEINVEKLILSKFFKVDGQTKRARLKSKMLEDFIDSYPSVMELINDKLEYCISHHFVYADGDILFISEKGIERYKNL
ncbi:MAG: pentapeptide repeat-containing protein [Ignavibacteria bacterium]